LWSGNYKPFTFFVRLQNTAYKTPLAIHELLTPDLGLSHLSQSYKNKAKYLPRVTQCTPQVTRKPLQIQTPQHINVTALTSGSHAFQN
jgi:hypothetical protein